MYVNAESESGGILQEKSPPQAAADSWNTINSTTHSHNSTANSISSTANSISSTANNISSTANSISSTANSISNPNMSQAPGERRFSLSGLDTLLNELGRDHSYNSCNEKETLNIGKDLNTMIWRVSDFRYNVVSYAGQYSIVFYLQLFKKRLLRVYFRLS
jgi:hypothetical protein